MNTIIARILNAVLGRPSVAKAIAWSLGVHASALAVTWAWCSSPSDTICLAGMRNVVQVEMSFARIEPENLDQPVVQIEQNAFRLEPLEDAAEPPLAEMLAPAPLEPLPLAKREFADRRRMNPPEIRKRPPEARRFAVCMEVRPRRAVGSPGDPADIPSVEALAELPRRQTEALLPPIDVTAQQVAGTDDKTPPDFSGNRPPVYPATAIARRFEGTVLLRLHIAATGRVERVEIVASSGHAILDRAALEAVSTWHGRPAQQAGKPRASTELLPVRFRL